MQAPYEREIHELHQFFQAWFSGSIPQTEANFARVTAALAPTFGLISPDGTLAEYATVIDWLRGGYGTRPGFRLWVEEVALRHQQGDLILATYVERQQIGEQTNARLSSALFQQDAAAPNGVVWLHVHETWLPAA
jgi:hypothetical protein